MTVSGGAGNVTLALAVSSRQVAGHDKATMQIAAKPRHPTSSIDRRAFFLGRPQCGQAGADEETLSPQSEHLRKLMLNPPRICAAYPVSCSNPSARRTQPAAVNKTGRRDMRLQRALHVHNDPSRLQPVSRGGIREANHRLPSVGCGYRIKL